MKRMNGTDAFSQLLSSHGHNLKLQKTQDGDDAAVKKLKPVLNPSLSQNMFVNFDANISSTVNRSDSRKPLYCADQEVVGSRRKTRQSCRIRQRTGEIQAKVPRRKRRRTRKIEVDEESAIKALKNMHGGVETVNWIQCCKCLKWRVVNSNISMEQISPTFICSDNTWAPQFSSCSVPEESHISDADFDGEANDVNAVASSLVNMSGGDANNINSGKRKPSLPPSSLNKLVISRKGRNRKDTRCKRKRYCTRKYEWGNEFSFHSISRNPKRIVAIAWGDGINSFEEVNVYDEDSNKYKVEFLGVDDENQYWIPKTYLVWRKEGNVCPLCDKKCDSIYTYKIHLNTHINDFDEMHRCRKCVPNEAAFERTIPSNYKLRDVEKLKGLNKYSRHLL